MGNFRTLDLAIKLHKEIRNQKLKGEVRDQIFRASLSVCLNLSEGDARQSQKDRRRLFNIALASLRETQTLILIEGLDNLDSLADSVGAHLYKLIHSTYVY